MRKLFASIAFGLLFSAASVSVYACATVLTVGNQVCMLTGSGTTPSGVQVCTYYCETVEASKDQ